jgi:hypothetical protein
MSRIELSQSAVLEFDLSTRNFVEYLLYISVYLPEIVLGKWQIEQLQSAGKELRKRFKLFMMEDNLSDFDPQPEWDDKTSSEEEVEQPKPQKKKKVQAIQLSLFFKKVALAVLRLFKKAALSGILFVEHLIKLSTLIGKRKTIHHFSDENRFRD